MMEAELDLGELGFWLFLAAVSVAFILSGAKKERSLHRLIEASIAKTGTIDPRLADLLEKEIARKAANDAHWWGAPSCGSGVGGSVRKIVSTLIASAGALMGFLVFVAIIARSRKGSDLAAQGADIDPIMPVLIAVGMGAAIAGLFGLIAWLIWPKKKKTIDSEPLV